MQFWANAYGKILLTIIDLFEYFQYKYNAQSIENNYVLFYLSGSLAKPTNSYYKANVFVTFIYQL